MAGEQRRGGHRLAQQRGGAGRVGGMGQQFAPAAGQAHVDAANAGGGKEEAAAQVAGGGDGGGAVGIHRHTMWSAAAVSKRCWTLMTEPLPSRRAYTGAQEPPPSPWQ